jgi:hypothetical protein
VVSVRSLIDLGCFVDHLSRTLSIRHMIDFSNCSNWEQVDAALAEPGPHIRALRNSGWLVDNTAWTNEPSHVLIYKAMPRLRTLADEAAAAQRAARILVPAETRPQQAVAVRRRRTARKRADE